MFICLVFHVNLLTDMMHILVGRGAQQVVVSER